MLTRERLTRLHRDLRDEPVLSVYLDTDQHDPALRSAWRTRLDRACTELRRELEEEGEDPAAFLAAQARLEGALETDGFLEGKGWVAFAGPGEVHLAGPVPFPVADQLHWDEGVHLAAYFRGLRQLRPVVVALVDRRHARFLRYREGVLMEKPAMVAFQDLGDVTDSNVAKRAARRTGVRGATGRDLANRFLEVEAERLHQEVIERLQKKAGRDGLILIGGPTETASHLVGMLDREYQPRARVLPRVSLEEEVTAMIQPVEEAVSTLSRELQTALLEKVLDGSQEAVRGVRQVRKAIREGRAGLLLVSEGLLAREPELVDQLVDAALDQGTEVELLVGKAGERLDQEEGAAVRLRY